jgi:Xaa-Pro aminopeptidase
MKTEDKLNALKSELKNQKVDGFLVPRADEYQGEYVPACSERLSWLTGFTGSAGMAIVLDQDAVVMTDGRYTIQIKKQVDQKLFQTADISQTSASDWLISHSQNSKIGYDPKLHTISQIEDLKSKVAGQNIELVPLSVNPVDNIWSNRPSAPQDSVELFSEQVAGKSSQEKRADIAKNVQNNQGAAFILTSPDSIAWILNIRGNDVPHTPFALSYAIVHETGDVDWFIKKSKVDSSIIQHLGNHVRVHEPEDMSAVIHKLGQDSANDNKNILLDFNSAPIWFKTQLEKAGASVKHTEDPCIIPKACKTSAEQSAIIKAHIKDGVAMTKFLKWLEKEAPKGSLTEIDVEAELLKFRQMDQDLSDTSFDTIAGWGANGAIVHYRATKEDHKTISPPGILLVDSGGQYKSGGTTDITRTIAVGEPTDEMKKNFTRVLKGHIKVAKLKFPEGLTGAQIDVLARQALWDAHLDYAHGTGHGVGCYLSVHEAGVGISPRANSAFQPGMLVSNEPGYYKEGEYGIRIESLILVKEDNPIVNSGPYTGKKMLKFETVTLAPIDKNLIVPEMLDKDELEWLNDYHNKVYTTLSQHLSKEDAKWLKNATAAINGNKPQQLAQNKPVKYGPKI